MAGKQTASGKKNCQVSFLPWTGLKNEIRIGPILFWPFNSNTQDKIQDQEILNHLTNYFHCYVDYKGQPVDTVIICSHGNIDFRCLTDEEYTYLRSAVDILIFCTIALQTKNAVCANNRSMGPPSAEMFQLISLNPGDDHIDVRAGNALHGGWKIGEISFPKPWPTGGSFGTPDTELIEGFSKVFDPTFSNGIRDRLFRSLEWFRLAHVENDEVSSLSKVVMMSTAFEILLQFPKKNKKIEYFIDYIEKNIASDNFKKGYLRKAEDGTTRNLTLAARWARDFYNLRSNIVHGDHVEQEQLLYRDVDLLTHLIVADLVFWECIKRELFKQKCIGDNVRNLAKIYDDAFPNEQEETTEEPLAGRMLGFNEVHQTLGWLEEKLD